MAAKTRDARHFELDTESLINQRSLAIFSEASTLGFRFEVIGEPGTRLLTCFTPSPLTGEGGGEGERMRTPCFKRLRRYPLSLALSRKGRGDYLPRLVGREAPLRVNRGFIGVWRFYGRTALL